MSSTTLSYYTSLETHPLIRKSDQVIITIVHVINKCNLHPLRCSDLYRRTCLKISTNDQVKNFANYLFQPPDIISLSLIRYPMFPHINSEYEFDLNLKEHHNIMNSFVRHSVRSIYTWTPIPNNNNNYGCYNIILE